jgi:formylglycine-generating enzyme required for sulfatase activity
MSQKFCIQCSQPLNMTAQFCSACGRRQPAMTGQLTPQTMLDNRYVIDQLLGQGGMGAVYRAIDLRISGRVCAIKEMSALSVPAHDRPQAIRNFQQEAELLARLSHPNLPKVHDRFEDAATNRHYLVMDFVEGYTLEQLLMMQQGRPLPETQVRVWAWQLCDVLTYLHNQNPPIIFRDLKPANIMLEPDGKIKLIDFGIARFFKLKQTKDTQAMGTLGYVPPEQQGRGQTDPRSDIYSLGVTLWRLLTAQEPADNPYNLPPVQHCNPVVSHELNNVIAQAMQLQPDRRFQTALEFRNALQQGAQLTDPYLQLKPVSTSNSSQTWRQYAPFALIGILLIVVVGAVSGFWNNNATAPPTANTPTIEVMVITTVIEVTAALPDGRATSESGNTLTPSLSVATATLLPATNTSTPMPLPTAPPPPTIPPSPIPTASIALAPSFIGSDGVEMVLIPAGWFTMGSSSADVDAAVNMCLQKLSSRSCPRSDFSNEMPQRQVYISDFYMGITPITNGQYRACVNAGVCAAPSDSGTPDNRYAVANYYNQRQYDNYPVVRVRWEDGQNYCRWISGRLPTEAEWEKAARGAEDARIFPWGNSFDHQKAIVRRTSSETPELRPVASYANGRSPYGLYDMAGSVWEYIHDWYSATYYQNAPDRDPQGPASGTRRVIRGGSYSNYEVYARVTNRGTPTEHSRSGFRGFRCVMDAN